MKQKERSKLHIEYVDKKRYKILSPLIYEDVESYIKVVVPSGFITNLSSVPRIPFIFTIFGGYGDYASVFHDWLYHSKELSRKESDKIFKKLLIETGNSKWRSELMYLSVRLFGWLYWK